ncbi:MAG TPA: Flp pilus assembly protein CpaB [Planctomycetaceae bacterium]|nr:Flp pilus assembly protein CpaB [Planctomycetaceae bacterium]
MIRPQDRVDVLVYLRRNPSAGIQEATTKTILRNIRVYAVGSEIKIDPATDERDAMPAKTMSLLVTPPQAQVLDLAQNLGRVSLVMRPPGEKAGENETNMPAGFTIADLLGGRTESGDRAREESQDNPLSTDRPDGLLGMLDGMKSKPDVPVAAVDAAVWSMRLLTGSELQDITLEETTSPSGEKLWRIGSGEATPEAKPSAPDTTDQLPQPADSGTAASGPATPATPAEPDQDEPLFDYGGRE